MPATRRIPAALLGGDFVAILTLSVAGFYFHNHEFNTRLWATLLPSLAGWAALAPWLGVYRAGTASHPLDAWRAALAGFFAAPLVAWLRGLWLNAAIPPIFILVLALTTAFGMGLWRLIWGWLAQRGATHG